MADDQRREQSNVTNEISDETGQYDARFILWRQFCAQNSISVEMLPSQLSGEAREKWEKLKDERLRKPEEK